MKKESNIYVVIGSSAGGLEALSNLVAFLPENINSYYFLAQHHAAGEKNILATILNKYSKIEVVLVEQNTIFEKNILYILPPELKIIVKNNKPIIIKSDISSHIPLPNVDSLFNELCNIKDSKLIAVLLSGTGNDGTKGMKTVKNFDGITIAQTPDEAMFDSMINNAIEANVVDYVLNIKDIATKIEKLSVALRDGTYESKNAPFDIILKTLYEEKQLDLFKYKEETIYRRIQKRMDYLSINTIEEYSLNFIDNKQEINNLYQDCLIGVTEFFRDIEAFYELKIHIKQKIIQKKDYSEFRIWSVACSSGEEAYSLAIMVNEICEELDKKINIKIFASDINDIALEKARVGEYKESALKNIKKELLNKYFVKTEYGYRVEKSIREKIVFAHHNFMNTPPFTNIDLLSCRNVLIYLKSDAQDNIYSTFHYSLNASGLLFLGSSESILNYMELFDTIDDKYRIYEKKNDIKQSNFYMELTKKYNNLLSKKRKKKMSKTPNIDKIEKHLKESLFEYVSNVSLIVDNNLNIVYKKGIISYLHFNDGMLSLNLLDNLDKQLHHDTRILIKKVQLTNIIEKTKFIKVESSENEMFVQLIAQPFVIDNYSQMILINFQEISNNELISNGILLSSFDEKSMVSSLTSQIKDAQLEIQDISDELAFSKQNMTMLNGELQESNEKLQSTVEELETSNEELQSSNEELHVSLSSNKELQNRLSLILDSSMNGVLGLDMEARHTFVNKRAAEMFGYSQEYLIGKDSHSLWHHTKADGSYYPNDECPITSVLKDGISGAGEDLFWRKDGTSFPVEFMRSPIIEDGKITGAVVSFYDISEKKALEEKSKQDQYEINNITQKYEETFKLAEIGIAHLGLDGRWIDVNSYMCNLVGYTKNELQKLTYKDITHPDDLDLDLKYINQLLDGELDKYQIEKRYIRKNGNTVWVNLSVVLIRDRYNKPLYFISIIQDISQRKMLIYELESKKNEFKNIIHFAPNPILIYSESGTIIMINEAFTNLTGYNIKDIPTIKKWNEKLIGSKNVTDKVLIENLFKENKSVDSGRMKVITKSGKELIWLRYLAPLGNIYNGERTIIYAATDITDMQEKEELMLSQSRQAAMGDMIGMIAHQWRQPLSVISMAGNNLRVDLELGEDIKDETLYELVDTLNEQTQSLSHTIDDFRTFMKPQKEKERVSLCYVYEKLKNMIGKTLENNSITLNFINNCDVEFYTFTNELIQVFANLLNNSKDAYKDKNIKDANIDIITTIDKNLIVIEIKDQAGGIDKNILNKLGEPYVSTKSKNGTGLGIYMSKLILEKHFNGSIKWKNVGKGTSFIIELPTDFKAIISENEEDSKNVL